MNLDRLWRLTGQNRVTFKETQTLYFDAIGLILLKDIQNFGYWCTPTNTLTFATTGGDGVHFSFLSDDEAVDDNCPIVMTIPNADMPNMIVGENLLDFLSLGYRCGFFNLEQIVYNFKKQVALLDTKEYPKDMEAKEIELLKTIENEFLLKPWDNHISRLHQLRQKYIHDLKYSSEYYEVFS